MQTGYISFCDSIGLNIKSDAMKKTILDNLEQNHNTKIITRHFEKFVQDKSVKILNSIPHIVSLRTNGNPYFLLLTRLNNVETCIFIDKKVQCNYFYPRMIINRNSFEKRLFDETLFDGEMVKAENGQWIFVINDILVYSGEELGKKNIFQRLEIVDDILTNKHRYSPTDIFSFQIKKYVKYGEVRSLIEDFMPSLPYTCRGLYFKPLHLKFKSILYNFDDSLVIKVKRIKYESNGFLLKSDTERLISDGPGTPLGTGSDTENHGILVGGTTCTESPQSRATATDMGNDVNIPSPVSANSNTVQFFYVEKTSIPDYYKLYEGCAVNSAPVGTACVSKSVTSKLLMDAFCDKELKTKIKMECKWSDRFSKWIPVAVCG